MDYAGVTEAAGGRVTREALSMLYTRYRYAAPFVEGKDILEVACGPGPGLGYLARRARHVVGGDITESLVRQAREHYGGRLPVLRLDAHHLPFRDRSFDVALLYEAVYYLAQPTKFLEDCHRVLREDGVALLCTVNREWSDFNPSPFSTRYFSARELTDLFRQCGFGVEMYGAFEVSAGWLRDVAVSLLRRTAIALDLVPKTMQGKELLKRVFLGALAAVPGEVEDGMAEYDAPMPISADGPCARYKVLYAVARLR